MSIRTELAAVAVLTVALVAAVLLARATPKPTVENEPASTYRTGPGGAKAVYDVLARLHVPVERRRRPLFGLTRDERHRPGILAVVAVVEPLEPAELDQISSYLRDSGSVVAVGTAGGLTRCLGWVAAPSYKKFEVDSLPVTLVAAESPELKLPRVVRYLRPVREDSIATRRTIRRRSLVEEPRETGCRLLVAQRVDTLLRTVGDTARPAILALSFRGGGRAVLVADPAYMKNRTWRSSDVPTVMVPLLRPQVRGPLVWDEYHHGYGKDSSLERALAEWIIGTPWGWALLQLVAVVLVAIGVSAVRFGPALSVIERKRRSPLEHLEALAAGLEGAAGAETALRLIVSGLRRRLSRSGYIPRGETGGWLASLELATPTPRGRAAVRRLQSVTTHPGGAERVLAAAQAVEDVWQELRPKTRDGF